MKKTNIDSPFYRTMGKIGDLLFSNLLFWTCLRLLLFHAHSSSLL